MATALSNELIQEVSKLAKILAENFTPPEFIPGCEVISIADINEYATNNGWVEAVCGQHNQQRVRWKSSEIVANGNFIDVLYFQDRGIFEAYGVGGSTAVAGATHNLLSATHPDTLADSVVAGDIIIGNATPKWARLAKGTDGEVLTLVSGLPSWETATGGITDLTGDVTATGPGSVAATIANDAVTNAKAADMVQATIKGRAAAAGTGDPTDLTAAQVATILAGLLNSWPRPGKVNIGTTEYSSIGAAITASIAGDILKIGEGTFAETITVNKSIALIALDPNTTTISTSTNDAVPVTITAAVAMINIQCQQTGAGTTGYACEVSTGGSLQAWNCIFSKPSGAPTTAAGLKISSVGSTGSRLKYCLAQALAGTTKHGLWTSKHTEVVGGKYIGSTASIKVDNSAILDLDGLPRLSATLYDATGGTILGMFVDANGDLYNLGLTASRAVVTDANKKVISSAVTATELGYVSGVTSALQTQINNISVDIGLCEGRLTLTTAVPVTTTDVTAATTIYFTPYAGNRIALYTSSVWTLYNFTEKSLSLSGFTANKNNDVFLYDNAGTLTLERVEWTNDTTRATALTTQDGVLVKSGSTNKRYLGTFRTTGTTGQCEDSSSKRYCWNYYNRVERTLLVTEQTTHTWNTGSWRAWNNNQANADIEFVLGVAEIQLMYVVNCQWDIASGESSPNVGAGQDTTAGNNAPYSMTSNVVGTNQASIPVVWSAPAVGHHYICVVEFGAATPPDLLKCALATTLMG